MKHFEHKVSAIFEDSQSAIAALEQVNQQFPTGVKSFLVSPEDKHPDRKLEPETESVKNEMITDTLTGAGAGAVLGGAAAGVLGVGGVAMIVASPVVAALWGLGYGSVLGGIAGAAKAFRLSDGEHAAMVKDALDSNFHAVVVHAKDEDQAAKIEASLQSIAESTHHS